MTDGRPTSTERAATALLPGAGRASAIAAAQDCLTRGALFADVARRVAMRTESRDEACRPLLRRYLEEEIAPALNGIGFSCRIVEHGLARGPFLMARRIEDEALPTVFGYGHGDVVGGSEGEWAPGLGPWILKEHDGRWYGRGVVDNKGQHSINIAALAAVLEARGGRLGFNLVYLVEMGEEVGSPGLAEVCAEWRSLIAADVLIASDGPRVSPDQPTIYLGARGAATFSLSVASRDGTYHSGNWGGLLSNPGLQIAHALASIASSSGRILIPDWVPDGIPDGVRRALADCRVDPGPKGPEIDPAWGEPGLSPAEQVYGWCSFDVLALEAGNSAAPLSAVPDRAKAVCQLRFVVGVDEAAILPALRRHLDRHGFGMVEVRIEGELFHASRLDPDDPWVGWARASLERSTGKRVTVLPNVGASLPNEVFADLLGMRTIWIPHSHPAAANHGPNENVPLELVHEALGAMAGIYWDLGDVAENLPLGPWRASGANDGGGTRARQNAA